MNAQVRRLMFVTDAPAFGGAEAYILSTAQAARRREIETQICWFGGDDSAVFDHANTCGSRLHIFPRNTLRNPLKALAALRGLLLSEGIDAAVVNASGRPSFWCAALAARTAGVRCAWVHHMVDPQDPRRLPARWCGGRIEGLQLWRVPQALRHMAGAAAADAVIVSNADDGAYVRRWHRVAADKLALIPPGVDTDAFRPSDALRMAIRAAWAMTIPAWSQGPEPFVVGTAGRLVEGKGVDVFIAALAELRSRGLPAVGVVAGDGPERGRLMRQAAALGLDDAVLFEDFTGRMAGFYTALDAFALCSRVESFGLVLAEARSCGCAVVATPTAGGRMQIVDGEDGLLAPAFTPAAVADVLERLGRDAALRERLGRRGRAAVVKKYSVERALERTLTALHGGRVRDAEHTTSTCVRVESSLCARGGVASVGVEGCG